MWRTASAPRLTAPLENVMFKKLSAGVAGALGLVGSSFAAVPVEVTTAIADGKTDMLTVAGLMLGVFIALVGYKLIRRAAH